MKKTLILLITLVFLSLQMQAQKGNDVLYLKNGSIVYGKLIEVVDNQYKIKTDDGLIFSFSSEEVEKFILGLPSESKKVAIKDPNGFGIGLESGFLIGSGNENFFLLFSFNPMITYTVNTRHTFSFVTGIELFDQFHIPAFLEYKYNLFKKDVSPFLYARGGGLISLGGGDSQEYYKGGWSCGAGAGLRWPIAGFESYIKFGYRYGLTVHIREETYVGTSLRETTFHNNFYRLEMKWGFKF
jgi:hypothetical protein